MSLKARLLFKEEPVYLMDGSAYIYRGFFANRSMQRSDGFPTNAVYVVSRILLRILREEKPKYFVFVLDGHGKNFRHELFPLYKANRDAAPEDLVRQLEPVKRIVEALGIRLEISSGCEADDCIASLASRFSQKNPVVIISGDKDLRQCLKENVYMWDPGSKEEKVQTLDSFRAEYGVNPPVWADIQALIGDTADNIPGVPGIGPKTAEKIFCSYSSLEDIRDRIETLDPKIRKKIEPHVEAMFLYRKLTRLSLNECSGFSLEDALLQPMNAENVLGLAAEFEMNALRRDIGVLIGRSEQKSPKSSESVEVSRSQQGSLLSVKIQPAAIPELSDPETLPTPCGKKLAFLYPSGFDSYPVLAIDNKQWRYTGNAESLAAYAAQADEIVSADVKSLLRHYPCWEKISSDKWFDICLAAYLINPEESDYGWPKLAARMAPLCNVAVNDAGLLALHMAKLLRQDLQKHNLEELFKNIELPLVGVLARMEAAGITIDRAAFSSFLGEVQTELDALTAQVYASAGSRFNIRSAQQLGEVLFSSLQLPMPKKTKGGQYSTDVASLEKLAGKHPIIDSILQYRKLEKMRSTYLEPFPHLVDSKGRIHTSFNQMATATGRLSSSRPNLQNIPVRGSLGKRMRACFIAGEGCCLVSADYSQVELRVLAHMSKEPALCEAFSLGEDIHTRTAAHIYGVPPEDISADMRRSAKTINFGLIYGMGAQKLAGELHITLQQAKDFISRYFSRFSKLKSFYEGIQENARQCGFVTTLAGRCRPLPGINSRSQQTAALARRQAVNTVIQGTAADIIKLAMLEVDKDRELAGWGGRQVLQIHDELLVEVPEIYAEKAASRVTCLMENVRPGGEALAVPLVVECGMAKTWADAH